MNLSVNHDQLPAMWSYRQSQRPDGTHVQRYINEKSPKLLKVLGEELTEGGGWVVHSHGAWAQVKTESKELFERILLVLPRPEQQSAKLFTPWAERRLRYLGRYLERTNSGRIVRILPQKQVVIGVLMRRKGHDLQDPKTPLPSAREIPELLKLFSREVQMYISWMNDPELSYVQALKLNEIPQLHAPSILKLTLDVLPTTVGLRGRLIPLSPVTLMRGVIGELAEQLDLRSDELEPEGEGLLSRFWSRQRLKKQRAEALACVRELDALAARVDLMQPDFVQLSRWVEELTGGQVSPLVPVKRLIALAAFVAALYLAWGALTS